MGNVIVETDSIIIFADSAENRPADRTNTAVGNVFLQAKYSDFFLTAGLTIDSRRDNTTLAYNSPVLFRIDTTKGKYDSTKVDSLVSDSLRLSNLRLDTMSVSCDSLRAVPYKGDRLAEFMGSVEMYRERVTSKSMYASYAKPDELIALRGAPMIWFDSTQLSGDSIFITLPKQKLESIHSAGHAIAGSIADTTKPDRINQISADDIKVNFERDSIRQIAGLKNAKTLYFYKSEEGEELAARNAADSVFIKFVRGEVNDIIWTGGVQGQNYPDSMVITQAKSFFLPNFTWSTDRPKKRILIMRTRDKE
jgi:hypothetical protein